MEFVTKDLRIIPLTTAQFRMMLDNFSKMEKEFKLKASKQKIEGHFKDAMEELYNQAVQHEDEYVWYTNWQIVLKSENESIGSFCFKGEPDADGCVEIGYGLVEKYRGQGYMTEVLKIMVRWAKASSGVKYVTAYTDSDNEKSQNVLVNAGFEKFTEKDGTIGYRI